MKTRNIFRRIFALLVAFALLALCFVLLTSFSEMDIAQKTFPTVLRLSHPALVKCSEIFITVSAIAAQKNTVIKNSSSAVKKY